MLSASNLHPGAPRAALWPPAARAHCRGIGAALSAASIFMASAAHACPNCIGQAASSPSLAATLPLVGCFLLVPFAVAAAVVIVIRAATRAAPPPEAPTSSLRSVPSSKSA